MTVIRTGEKAVYPIIYEVNYGQMKSINCFLYQDGNVLTLIDAGIDLPAFHTFFDAKLLEYGFTMADIDQILLTHHHGDHIGLVNRIVAEKQIPIYAHYLAVDRLHLTGEYQLKKRDFFMQLYEEYGGLELAGPRLAKMDQTLRESLGLRITSDIIALYDGDCVGGLQVQEVAGHSLDSILFYDLETKWLFVGDLVLFTGTTNALVDHDADLNLLPTVAQYEQSLRKCLAYEASFVFAGHQEPYTNLSEIVEKNLQRVSFKLGRLIEKIASGHHTALQLAMEIYPKQFEREFPLVMSEVIGYAIYAEMKGLIKRDMQEGKWYFSLKNN